MCMSKPHDTPPVSAGQEDLGPGRPRGGPERSEASTAATAGGRPSYLDHRRHLLSARLRMGNFANTVTELGVAS
jgi:hypothetical protein